MDNNYERVDELLHAINSDVLGKADFTFEPKDLHNSRLGLRWPVQNHMGTLFRITSLCDSLESFVLMWRRNKEAIQVSGADGYTILHYACLGGAL
jgi:hypothetical protein